MTLLEKWGDSLLPAEVINMGYDKLLEQVKNLYNSGDDWQHDGTPEEVADAIWGDATKC